MLADALVDAQDHAIGRVNNAVGRVVKNRLLFVEQFAVEASLSRRHLGHL